VLLLSGITVLAAVRTEDISVTFRNIRLVVNGELITPRDAQGNIVEPFIFDGTTFLPVRAVANALGVDVDWDGNTSTVYLGSRAAVAPTPTPPPAQGNIQYEITNVQERTYITSRGVVRYETLVQFTNTGTMPIYLGMSRFDLVDTNGRILSAGNSFSSFPNIIHPGERGYFYGNVDVPEATPETDISMVPRWDLRRSRENRINFDLSDIEIRDGTFGTTVFGRITNNTGEEQTWAIISVVLYAQDGTPIGVWMTNAMETMQVGSSFGFEISNILQRTLFDNVTPDMVYSFVAFAYPPQWQF